MRCEKCPGLKFKEIINKCMNNLYSDMVPLQFLLKVFCFPKQAIKRDPDFSNHALPNFLNITNFQCFWEFNRLQYILLIKRITKKLTSIIYMNRAIKILAR